MRDEKSVEVSRRRRPRAHTGAGARPIQVDGTARAGFVPPAVGRKMLLMRAPPQLRRLRAFADKTIDRPGIHEFVGLLRHIGNLGVAFGHVNDLDAQRLRQLRPAGAVLRNAGLHARVLGDVQERLFDQVRHQAGIGAMREDRRRRILVPLAQPQGLQAHGVIAARFDRHAGVRIAAGPRFNAGIQIQRAALTRQLQERHTGYIHRQIQQEIAGAEGGLQNPAVVLGRQRRLDEFHAKFLGFRVALVFGRDDGDAIRRSADVTQDQRQDTLSDAAETDHDDPAREFHMHFVCAHNVSAMLFFLMLIQVSRQCGG